jgi:hypothetical protein
MSALLNLGDKITAGNRADATFFYKKRVADDSGTLLTEAETDVNNRELLAQKLFDKASIVYTAGGVKASKAYSVKGTDFGVTRAGVKNVIGRDGLLTEIPANTPATEFANGVLKGTLIEPARTNLLQRSEEFDGAVWVKSGSVNITANDTIAPDGTTTADKIVSTTDTSTEHRVRQNPGMGTSTTYTASCWVKKADVRYFYIRDLTGNRWVVFDLDTTSVTFNSSGIAGAIESYSNNWFRIIATFTTPSSITNNFLDFGITVSANNFSAALGIGDSGFIWGAQLEVGSEATSYIRTTDTAITQPADVITATGVSSVLPQTEGWMYAEVDVTNFASNAPFLYAQENANLVNRIELQKRDTSVIRAFSQKQISGTPVASQVSTPVIGLGVYKLLMKLEPIGYKLFVNGSLIASNTTQENPNTLDTVRIGSISTGAGQPGDPIHSIAIGIGPISDAEAITLTTL